MISLQYFGYGGGFGLTEIFYRLQDLGVFDVLLPFMLIFSILFAVLQKVNIFGTSGKRFNGIIAFSISLLAVVPHVLGVHIGNFDLVDIINKALPQIALILIVFVLFLVFVGMVSPKQATGKWMESAVVPLIAAIIILFIFGSAAYPQYMPSWLAWLGDPMLQTLVIVLLIFGLIVYFVTAPDKQNQKI